MPGRTWLERDVRLDRDDAGTAISRFPQVAATDNGQVAVVWEDDRNGHERILLNYSTDGGKTWAAQERTLSAATEPPLRARAPQVAWDPKGQLHVVWEAWRGDTPRAATRTVHYARVSVPN